MSKHLLIGGNSTVGRGAAELLVAQGHDVTVVGRSAASIAGVRPVVADVLDAPAIEAAVAGSDVVYLLVGLPYRLSTWRREWPPAMRSTIDAATATGAHLVFLDNVYAYGRVSGPMTEKSPIHPTSKKGEVRAQLVGMLDEARSRGLVASIARAADFYGPGAETSVFNSMAVNNAARGKRPVWLLDSSQPHSMTYTPDIARAITIIGTDPRAAGRTWHVPTAPALTGDDYLEMLGAGPANVMSGAMLRLGGLFVPAAREAIEMGYQSTSPYVFDSSAFETAFGVEPTPYAQGIERTLQYARGGVPDPAVATRS